MAQSPSRTDVLTNELLEVIRQLLNELQPHSSISILLDSELSRDLGLDSLSRVELIARIEKHFHIVLPERVFAEALTPRDLLRAVSAVQDSYVSGAEISVSQTMPGKTDQAPETATTLVEVLRWHAQQHPDRPHIRFYQDEGEGECITYQQLWQGAVSIAAALQHGGIEHREPVAIMLPSGKDYFLSFFGVLLAGGVPVTLYPPANPAQLADHLRRHQGILNNCRARILITVSEAKGFAKLLRSLVSSIEQVTTVDALQGKPDAWHTPPLTSRDTAFLQYTSGSTGNPKGVILTHANLLANIRAMGSAVNASSEDVFVSWLPLYHDMGLIGAWLGSLYYACPLLLMSPLAFLARPQRWLWAIHRYRGTMSAAPNFAFELCLHRLQDEDLDGLDLSSWRAAFNGAEPVNPDTTLRFCERFESHGFRASSMMPVYGLAESAVGLAFPPLYQGPVIDRIQRRALMENGKAVPADSNDQNALRFIACGRPLAGHQIRIIDSSGRECPDREEGRLQFRGPSCTSGYYRNAAATRDLFDGEWLDSGDMAYIADGDVYITGRIKDIIIRAGRNIYPHEVEESIGNIEGIRNGRVAVFGSMDAESRTEKLVVIAETRTTSADVLQDLRTRINAIMLELTGAPADDIVIAPPNTVLKTSSGKIRRAACRERYEQHRLGEAAHSPLMQIIHVLISSWIPLIYRLRRRATALAYACYAWPVFMLLAIPSWIGVVLLPNLKLRWKLMGAAVRTLARLTFTPLQCEGLEHLPIDKPCILVCNHMSYLDGPILIGLLKRQFCFVAKGELRRKKIPRLFLQAIHAEFVERIDKRQSVVDARRLVEKIKRGEVMMFFAEGTFSRQPGLLPFHMGAFVAAVSTQVPIVPVSLRGTRSILRSNTWFPRHGAVSVTVSEALWPDQPADESEHSVWQAALKLKTQVRQEMLRHLREPDLNGEPHIIENPQ